MTSTLWKEPIAEMLTAVRRVYEEAGLDQSATKPEIVPLYDLIGAYPIRVAELKDLTYQIAADFLRVETGQRIPIPARKDKPLAGYLYVYEFATQFYGCILVKANDMIQRRRFSAAHELGHYVLHFLPRLEREKYRYSSEPVILAEGLSFGDDDSKTSDLPWGDLSFIRGSKPCESMPAIEQMEREANQFAAEILMPAASCQALFTHYNRQLGNRPSVLIRRLATELLVSKEAMKWRLTNLGLLQRKLTNLN